MFGRLDKFDGPIFEGVGGRIYGVLYAGSYIRDVNWVTYLGGVYSGGRDGGLYTGSVLTEFYGTTYLLECDLCNVQYVGKSETTFNIRLNNHRKDVKGLNTLPADKHFTLPGHGFNNNAKLLKC